MTFIRGTYSRRLTERSLEARWKRAKRSGQRTLALALKWWDLGEDPLGEWHGANN